MCEDLPEWRVVFSNYFNLKRFLELSVKRHRHQVLLQFPRSRHSPSDRIALPQPALEDARGIATLLHHQLASQDAS